MFKLNPKSTFLDPVGHVRSHENPLIADASGVTVIIPAYNESASIADTVRSLQQQSAPPAEIIVIDDCSSDGTGDAARACGVTVVRPPRNTGSKAGAQNFALGLVKTSFTMAVDADTILAPNALEKLMAAFADPKIAAACGFVVPRFVKTVWERGRYVEYLMAFSWYKPIQDYYSKPLISSGCFSVYRTPVLRANGGWSTRTLAEDMDLTWSFYAQGYGVRFISEAVCYPIEPHDFNFMSKQLRRWSHGFIQNVRLHWKDIIEIPHLRVFIAVALWDAVVASIAYLFLLPILAILLSMPILLAGYIIDLPVVLVSVLREARERHEVGRVLASIPSFFVLRTVNAFFLVEALFSEIVLGRKMLTYEKGH